MKSQLAFVFAVVILLGGLLLASATFLGRPWTFAYWVRVAFWIIGLSGVAWAILELIMLVHGHSFSRDTYRALDHYRTLLTGVGIGLLSLFFLSGEAFAAFKRWHELKKGRNSNI